MTNIPYTIRVSTRAKHVRITVHRDATVVVTVPQRASLDVAKNSSRASLRGLKKKWRAQGL